MNEHEHEHEHRRLILTYGIIVILLAMTLVPLDVCKRKCEATGGEFVTHFDGCQCVYHPKARP